MRERWKPEEGERYYFIDPLGNVNWYLYGDSTDTLYYKVGNCFKTEEEAQHVSVLFKKLLQENILRDKDEPYLSKDIYLKRWINYDRFYPVEGSKFDATDWSNSLIEHPVKLPDWCKVGEWVFDKAINKYSQVAPEDITEHLQEVCKSISKGEIVQARLRPYNEEEMKALVGKVVVCRDGVFLVLHYCPSLNKICVKDNYYNALELVDDFTMDGKPCGVLAHLENGEWVE